MFDISSQSILKLQTKEKMEKSNRKIYSFCLCVKMSLRPKHVHFRVTPNSLSRERFCTKIRFETEHKGDLKISKHSHGLLNLMNYERV